MRRGRSGGRWCPGSQGRFFAGAPWCQQPAPRCRGGRRAGSAGLLGPRRPECQQRASGEAPSAARVGLAADPPQTEPTSQERCPLPGLPGIQWLRPCASDPAGAGSTPAGEDPTGHVAWPKKVKKGKEKKCLLSSQPFTEHASACSQPQECGGGCGSPSDVVLSHGVSIS